MATPTHDPHDVNDVIARKLIIGIEKVSREFRQYMAELCKNRPQQGSAEAQFAGEAGHTTSHPGHSQSRASGH